MRKRGLVLAAAVLMLALLTPTPAVAQTPPSISLNPICGVAGADNAVRVTGEGFVSGPDVQIIYQDQAVGETFDAENGTFVIDVVLQPPETGWLLVEAFGEGNDYAQTRFGAPCPRLEIDPTCSPAGERTLDVEGFNFPPTDLEVLFDGQVKLSGIGPDSSGYFFVTIDIAPSEERSYVVEVNDFGAYGVAVRRTFRVPCPPPTTTSTSTTSSTTTTSQPTTTTTGSTTTTTTPPATPGATLTVNPPLGRGGTVTIARGTGFTPGPVTLTWSPGIGTTAAVAGDDGTFQVQVLAFPNDRIGPRNLVAAGAATTATAAFLVVPDSMQPASRDVAQLVRTHRYLQR